MLFSSLPEPLHHIRTGSALALALSVLFTLRWLKRRTRKVQKKNERVVILGASSGIGRALAHEYARRGARVCVTARREAELTKVVEECRALEPSPAHPGSQANVQAVAADFTNADEMVHLRDVLERGKSLFVGLFPGFLSSLNFSLRVERRRYSHRLCWRERAQAFDGGCWPRTGWPVVHAFASLCRRYQARCRCRTQSD